MKLKKVCVCGHFGFGETFLDGQTIKTKNIAKYLCQLFGKDEVSLCDTHGGLHFLLRLPKIYFSTIRKCANIVFLPAQNGLRVMVPFLLLCNLFSSRRLHYVVIGGWLPDFLEKRRFLRKMLTKLHCIYVETDTMRSALIETGLSNVLVMPNFKELIHLRESELIYHSEAPFKLCTFSRVMKEKGIETAVKVVNKINAENGELLSLDIYGQVDNEQLDWFKELQAGFTKNVRYCGSVQADQSVETLKDYFALLFPTEFYTEGIPGTIIDAYAAGIPVVASKWESCSDIVSEKTGSVYPFDQANGLEERLLAILSDTESFQKKKTECLNMAKKYLPENAVGVLVNQLV